jgi:hypothetical protein
MRIFTPARFEIFLYVGLVFSSIMIGVLIGMTIEYRPPIKAQEGTAGRPNPGTFISGPISTGHSMSARTYLNAAVDPTGSGTAIHVDDKGRVIARCDLEP